MTFDIVHQGCTTILIRFPALEKYVERCVDLKALVEAAKAEVIAEIRAVGAKVEDANLAIAALEEFKQRLDRIDPVPDFPKPQETENVSDQ